MRRGPTIQTEMSLETNFFFCGKKKNNKKKKMMMMKKKSSLQFHIRTYTAHSLKHSDGDQKSEVSGCGEDGSQQRQHGHRRQAEQYRRFTADLLCNDSADDLCRCVAVVERSEYYALSLLIPDEYSVLEH